MIVTPGANQVLVLQSGLVLGHKAAIYNVLGVASSMFIHASLSGLGLSLLIVQSPGIYSFIKLLGSGYIVYLASKSLYSAYCLYHQQQTDESAATADRAVAPLPTTSALLGARHPASRRARTMPRTSVL